MNETQLIRAQLTLEREHLNAVARGCAQAFQGLSAAALTPGSPLQQLHQAASEYLALVLGWYHARDARVLAGAAACGETDPRGRALRAILDREGASREGEAKLAACTDPAAWQALAAFLEGPWSARREALERLLERDTSASEWRRISGIDADGILAERARFARIAALIPSGAGTSPPAPPA